MPACINYRTQAHTGKSLGPRAQRVSEAWMETRCTATIFCWPQILTRLDVSREILTAARVDLDLAGALRRHSERIGV